MTTTDDPSTATCPAAEPRNPGATVAQCSNCGDDLIDVDGKGIAYVHAFSLGLPRRGSDRRDEK